MTMELTDTHRYTIISCDTHAGGDIQDYRPYLDAKWHDDFDAWAAAYVNPFADLLAPTAYRSWDSDARVEEHSKDGITAEVLFPNTVPPFFQEGNLVALPPSAEEYSRRWAGVQAHNRWLADFCSLLPGRRAGIIQVFVNNIDDALAEIRWAKENFSPFGGILLPSLPPGCGLPPLWEPIYDPLATLRRARCADQHSRWIGHAGLWRARISTGHDARGVAVVLAPLGMALDFWGRVRALPRLEVCLDRTRNGLAPARTRDS